jgi:cell division protein FtsQ
MSRGGRWRLALSTSRTIALGVLIAALAWGVWLVVAALRENPNTMPSVAKSVPIKAPELVTSHGGVLDAEWLAHALALPANASLMELDLEQLRARLLSDGQVLTATLTRSFPDRLIVKVTERTPLARIKADFGNESRELLVARDGVVFFGHGYDRTLLDSLPWLGGMALVRDGAWFHPVGKMDVVAELLSKAQDEAPHLYESWHIISLQHLDNDHELEVTTKAGTKIVFNARGSFFMQLARLDYMLEKLAQTPANIVRIDLSLGREVPVLVDPPPVTIDPKTGKPRASVATSALQLFTSSQSKPKL